MKEIKVRITFTEDCLGTASADPKIHDNFIASNAPDAPSREEEIEAVGVEEVVEKAKTIFPKDKDGNPFFWDYQIKFLQRVLLGSGTLLRIMVLHESHGILLVTAAIEKIANQWVIPLVCLC
jgi:hypothetical protein